MGLHGIEDRVEWDSMGLNRIQWGLMRFQWVSIGFNGILWSLNGGIFPGSDTQSGDSFVTHSGRRKLLGQHIPETHQLILNGKVW